MSEKSYVDIEPTNFNAAVGERVSQEIFFTNRQPETYHDVVVTLRSPWQIKVDQDRWHWFS